MSDVPQLGTQQVGTELAAVRAPLDVVAEAARQQKYGTVLAPADDAGWTWIERLDPTEVPLDDLVADLSRRVGTALVLRRGPRCAVSVWHRGAMEAGAGWSASPADMLDLDRAREVAEALGARLEVDPRVLATLLRGGADPVESWGAAVQQLRVPVPIGFLDGASIHLGEHPDHVELEGRTPFSAFLEDLSDGRFRRSPVLPQPRSTRWVLLRVLGLAAFLTGAIASMVVEGVGLLHTLILWACVLGNAGQLVMEAGVRQARARHAPVVRTPPAATAGEAGPR